MVFFEQLLTQPYWYLFLAMPYLIGSIPFAYLITKFLTKQDIRLVGSKNVGSTNVTRIAGKTAGIITFLLDFFKAIFALAVVDFFITQNTTQWFSISLFLLLLGHTKNIFLGFRGGKGVACNFALWAYLNFFSSLLMFVVWFAFYRSQKVVSVASVFACFSLPLWVWFFSREYFLIAIISSFYIILLHSSNIIRLLKKKEHSFARE